MSTAHTLEDMMVAMDVVDTLRHHQELIDHELDSDTRRRELIKKLKLMYKAQGIEVTESLLAKGVDALEEGRFSHEPPAKGFALWLATLYINRRVWITPLLIGLLLLSIILGGYYALFTYPENKRINALPADITRLLDSIKQTAQKPAVVTNANTLVTLANKALSEQAYDEAFGYRDQLSHINDQLTQRYQVRIVVKPDEFSGVWRIPELNTQARNYYLIVEAVGSAGQSIEVDVLNEETGELDRVSRWGLRVNEAVFERVMSDKKDDGIIQNNIIGRKRVGQLTPSYVIKTTGGGITQW